MRQLAIVALALLVIVVLWLASYVAAGESGEVVVLHAGDTETRLWIVEHDGALWLRGDPDAGWVAALRAEPEVVVDRADERRDFIAEPVPEELATINELMAEKYGVGHAYIGFFLGQWKDALPIRLTLRDGAGD
jgi:hypothetical protein